MREKPSAYQSVYLALHAPLGCWDREEESKRVADMIQIEADTEEEGLNNVLVGISKLTRT